MNRTYRHEWKHPERLKLIKGKQRAYMSAYNRRRAKPSGATPEGGAARIAEMRLAEG